MRIAFLAFYPAPSEEIQHILTRCRGTAEVRNQPMSEVLNTVLKHFTLNKIVEHHDHHTMTQFILDCSSLNLSTTTRIDSNHPDIVRVCRDMCYVIHAERLRKLIALGLILHN